MKRRYMPGTWLFQKKVLIPCRALESIRWADRRAHVSLRRAEIKECPEYNPDVPIVRDDEHALHDPMRDAFPPA